jgi:hypothetical protein
MEQESDNFKKVIQEIRVRFEQLPEWEKDYLRRKTN